MSVPESIRSAVAGHSARKPIGVRIGVSRGQVHGIRRSPHDEVPATGTTGPMVLVLRVDTKREFAEVMLVHPYVELATSVDLVVSPQRSTMPYRTVVQTDTRAVIWTIQLETLIGRLDPEALGALGDVSVGQAVYRTSLSSGNPLRGRLDARWDFKAQEGHVIRSMAADCTSALLSDESPTLQHLADFPDVPSRLSALLDTPSLSGVVSTVADVRRLEEHGMLSPNNCDREQWPPGVDPHEPVAHAAAHKLAA